MKQLFGALLALVLCVSCNSTQPVVQKAPEIVLPEYPLGIIGVVEPVYVEGFAAPMNGRIDTGAEISSVDAKNIKLFERDGAKWVAFDIVNLSDEQKLHFEKPLLKKFEVKRIGSNEERYSVNLQIQMGKKNINAEFSLANREKFEYQVLIGRNILIGNAIVNPAVSNTLH